MRARQRRRQRARPGTAAASLPAHSNTYLPPHPTALIFFYLSRMATVFSLVTRPLNAAHNLRTILHDLGAKAVVCEDKYVWYGFVHVPVPMHPEDVRRLLRLPECAAIHPIQTTFEQSIAYLYEYADGNYQEEDNADGELADIAADLSVG